MNGGREALSGRPPRANDELRACIPLDEVCVAAQSRRDGHRGDVTLLDADGGELVKQTVRLARRKNLHRASAAVAAVDRRGEERTERMPRDVAGSDSALPHVFPPILNRSLRPK